MEYIRLGEISKTFGLLGQVKVYSLTSFPSDRFQLGTKLSLLKSDGSRTPVTVSYFREAQPLLILGFKEIKSIDEAENYLHASIEIEKDKAPLPKNYYRLSDLIGCEVYDGEKHLLGQVSDVLSNAPTKTLRVAREGAKDFFVPFLMGEFITSIDIAKKTIIINVVTGLL